MEYQDIQLLKGKWLYVAPISGLELTEGVGHEYRVNHVTFISASKLPRIRKRLGFPSTVGELKKKNSQMFSRFFNRHKTFAVCQIGGSGIETESKFRNYVEDELKILSLSQLGWGRRSHNARMELESQNPVKKFSVLKLLIGRNPMSMTDGLTGHYHDLVLSENWNSFQDEEFFTNLIRLIQTGSELSPNWKRDIYSAALFAGQSQASDYLPQAFLWNVIAIETLLTHRGDSVTSLLPERVEAFIGWTNDWTISNYEQQIELMYKKRCELVHSGLTENITIDNLLFTDGLLLNVFNNILRHIGLFPNKESLIEFSKKVQAEKTLGLRSKIRPRTVRFLNPIWTEQDKLKI